MPSNANAKQKALDTSGCTQSVQPAFIYNEVSIRNNFTILEHTRTCQAAASGIVSGILGLTGLSGFILYFLCVLIQALVWHYRAGFNWNAYFASRSIFLTHSLIGGLFTYVLFWVFIYGLVHVY